MDVSVWVGGYGCECVGGGGMDVSVWRGVCVSVEGVYVEGGVWM